MQRLTIRERLIAVALLPVLALLVAQALGAPSFSPFGDARPAPAAVAFAFGAAGVALALALWAAHSLAGALGDAVETIEAIVRAEQDAMPQDAEIGRSEVERLLLGIDQLAEILRE